MAGSFLNPPRHLSGPPLCSHSQLSSPTDMLELVLVMDISCSNEYGRERSQKIFFLWIKILTFYYHLFFDRYNKFTISLKKKPTHGPENEDGVNRWNMNVFTTMNRKCAKYTPKSNTKQKMLLILFDITFHVLSALSIVRVSTPQHTWPYAPLFCDMWWHTGWWLHPYNTWKKVNDRGNKSAMRMYKIINKGWD